MKASRKLLPAAVDPTQLMNTGTVAIVSIDNNGLLTAWNLQAEKITGLTMDEALRQDVLRTIVPHEHTESAISVLSNALKGEDTINAEIPVKHQDGSIRQVLFSATPRRDSSGHITGVIGVGQDITELRAKERALTQAQEMEAVGQLTVLRTISRFC